MKSRRRAEARGRWAEFWAALCLMAKGYRIIALRARTPFGEVDIAALKKDVLAIVEVKARDSVWAGVNAIPSRNQKRIAQAGLHLAHKARLRQVRLRFDLIVVTPMWRVHHVRDAWRMDH